MYIYRSRYTADCWESRSMVKGRGKVVSCNETDSRFSGWPFSFEFGIVQGGSRLANPFLCQVYSSLVILIFVISVAMNINCRHCLPEYGSPPSLYFLPHPVGVRGNPKVVPDTSAISKLLCFYCHQTETRLHRRYLTCG